MTTRFTQAFPSLLKESVLTHFDAVKWLLPLWVQTASFDYIADGPYYLEIVVHKDYREIYINVAKDWVDLADDRRRGMMIHELIHCFTVPLKTAVCEALEDLDVDEKIEKLIYRNINKAMESVTQDFAYVVERHLSECP